MPVPETLANSGEPAGRSSRVAHRLVVAWQHPVERRIDPIGFLTYDGHIYRFSYVRNALQTKDFRPLLGFADLYRSYSSEELFPLFAQRAMDPRRPDYHRYIESLGLGGEPGPWEQLTRSQGHRQGDTLQLLPEPILNGDELTCLFLVHGIRHAHQHERNLDGQKFLVTREQVETALAQLVPGARLALGSEPGNPVNPLAIMVVGSGVPLGWVPDLLAEDVHQLKRTANVTVTAEHVNGSDAPWHLRLLARLRATHVGNFRFFTGERWTPLAVESS